MKLPPLTRNARLFLGGLLGSVWVFHGVYSKLLSGVPRHRMIVARVLGDDWATMLTYTVGLGELFLGLWIWSGMARRLAAGAQTIVLITMNLLEVTLASDLLISAPGMLVLNAVFLTAGWCWALAPERSQPVETRTSLPDENRRP